MIKIIKSDASAEKTMQQILSEKREETQNIAIKQSINKKEKKSKLKKDSSEIDVDKAKKDFYITADFIIEEIKYNKKENLTLDKKNHIVIFGETSYEERRGSEIRIVGILKNISDELNWEMNKTYIKDVLNAIEVRLQPEKKNFNQIKCDIDEKNKWVEIEEKEIISPEIVEMANDIILKGDPVKFILDTHKTMHVGDDALATQLLVSIAIQSIRNSAGIHPKVSGESGTGKTHCCKVMAHLIPKKYILSTTLSDRAIYYVDIEPGTIIFSDDADPSEILVGIIKRATTNFQEGDKYTTLDKNLKKNELIIPPRIVWWLTSVDDNQSMELLNRQFGGGVDDSIEQDRKVFEFQKKLAKTGEIDLPKNQNVEICRAIIQELKSHLYTVIIPFIDDITWEDLSNRRNFMIFQDIIKSFTILRHMQREKNEDREEIYANEEDFNDALALYAAKEKNQSTKLTDVEIEFCLAINDGKEHTYEEIQALLQISKGTVTNRLNGKGNGIGLLDKVPGLTSIQRSRQTMDGMTIRENVITLNNFDISEQYVCQIALKKK